MAAGAPSSSPMKKPSASTVAKQAASARPGFQPSAAAQSTAMAISSGRIARTLRSAMDYRSLFGAQTVASISVGRTHAMAIGDLPQAPAHLPAGGLLRLAAPVRQDNTARKSDQWAFRLQARPARDGRRPRRRRLPRGACGPSLLLPIAVGMRHKLLVGWRLLC